MKFIHTADWHLGKLVQGVYMTDDQRHVLAQLVEYVAEEKPDAVLVAGDLYDRAVPPTEAVELLDEIVERIVIGLGTPVLAIAGNHDSPDRLGFATRIMEGRGFYLAGPFRADLRTVVLNDEHGEVHVHLVPYADPSQVRYELGLDTVRTHDDAMEAIVNKLASAMDPAARHLLVGHAFVTPGGQPRPNTSDSERVLSVGGVEHVRAELFAPFHYTALGHLHQPFPVGRECVRYAGSPLKYSISEEAHEKGFYIVELDGSGDVRVEKRALKPLRDMRRVVGTIGEIADHERSDDYVFVTLLDESPVLFPMEKVRAVYPNALHVERRPVAAAGSSLGGIGGLAGESEGSGDGRPSRQSADPVALFAAFYEEVAGSPLDDAKRSLFAEVFEQVAREEGTPG